MAIFWQLQHDSILSSVLESEFLALQVRSSVDRWKLLKLLHWDHVLVEFNIAISFHASPSSLSLPPSLPPSSSSSWSLLHLCFFTLSGKPMLVMAISVRIQFPFIYIFIFYYIHPLWNPFITPTSEYFINLSRNGTTNILDFYILFKNSLSQNKATEPSTSLSFNLPAESGSALFGTCPASSNTKREVDYEL